MYFLKIVFLKMYFLKNGFLKNLRIRGRPRGSTRRRAALKKIVVFRVPGTPGTAAFNGRGAEALAVVNRPEAGRDPARDPAGSRAGRTLKTERIHKETSPFPPPSSTLHRYLQSGSFHHLRGAISRTFRGRIPAPSLENPAPRAFL